MDLKISYEPSAKELTKASLVYAEKKPLLCFSIRALNIFIGAFFIIFLLKFFVMGLFLSESITAFGCALWLFARKPFHEWLLYQKMKRSLVIGKTLRIEISRNGIVWSGKGLCPGKISWDKVAYLLEVKNGFILPNTFNTFLWLPFRGFQTLEDVTALQELIAEKKVPHRLA